MANAGYSPGPCGIAAGWYPRLNGRAQRLAQCGSGSSGVAEVVEIFPGALLGVPADEVAELHHHGIGDVVIDGVALATAADEARVMQHLQVLGYVRLVALKLLNEFSHGEFALFERLQETEAEGLAQESKAAGNDCDHPFASRGTPCHGLTISPYRNMVIFHMKQNRRLIDVRQPGEFAAGHIEGSELVPLRRLTRACEEWDRKQPITLVCLSGHRAQVAHGQLRARGFADVSVLPGGIRQWRRTGKPLQQVPQTMGARVSKWAFRAGIVLASVALAHFASPWFLAIPAIAAVRWFAIG